MKLKQTIYSILFVVTSVLLFLTITHTTQANLIEDAEGQNRLWMPFSETTLNLTGERRIIPNQYRAVRADIDTLQQLLSQAPLTIAGQPSETTLVLPLPMPDGTEMLFNVYESPIMAPELAAKFPAIKTYAGQGIDDPTATTRLDWTPTGFHAIIFSATGTVYIDPYAQGDTTHYISYNKKDVVSQSTFNELSPEDLDGVRAQEIAELIEAGVVSATGSQLRTYRLAVAATGEYTQYHGGTVVDGQAAIVTTINRVTGIYEREIAVSFELIANNDTIVYTNPNTDPYTNGSGGTMLGQNQTNLDNVIGSANYDVGHVFSTGGGGVAYLGVICSAGTKARGVTGRGAPVGDPFDVDYVAHEMGHQFGGNHTFNGSAGACSGGNRNGSTAYEPGSGSTIQAYAGICGSQDLQNNSDDYFHTLSFDEMVAHTTAGSGSSCGTVTATGNAAPTANAATSGADGVTIPINTPFELTGSATDNDGDALTYNWEQFNLGLAGHPNSPVGNAPIFRTFLATTSPTRTFPKMSDIVNNTQTLGEILPSYTRDLTFRLTVRDNRSGGGGVDHDQIAFDVTDQAGPFLVTSPNTAVSWADGASESVTWDVANTTAAPVSCSQVNLTLSIDGGYTYPTTLVANTPNDGSEGVIVPNYPSTTARIRVECANNIFFDISNSNFTITGTSEPVIGAAKEAGTITDNGDGTFAVPYTIVIENLGNVELHNIQLTENLATTFAGATGFTVIAGSLTAQLTANGGFDGSADTNLLVGTDTLGIGQVATVNLTVQVTPGVNLGPYNNTVIASGNSPAGTPVTDSSDDGVDPDPDGDGNPDEPGENDPTPATFSNDQPIADAGGNQTVVVSQTVTLDGSGSSDGVHLPLTYGWAQTSGPIVSLSSITAVSPTFTAVAIPTVLTFTLTVTDSLGLASTPSVAVITINDVVLSGLTAVNNSPTTLGQTTTLTASISAGSNIIYSWDLGDGNSDSGAIISHIYSAAGSYTATVTATNGMNSQVATTLVTISNDPPTADAGGNQTVETTQTITLDGSGSTDADGHLPLTYGWAQTGGTSVSLSSITAVSPTFTAPTNAAILTFALVVTDSYGLPGTAANVSITVQEPGLVAQLTATPTIARPGDVVWFTLTLTNTGDLTLNNLASVTAVGGNFTLPNSIDVGITTSYTYSYTVLATDLPGPLTNVVTVTAQTPLGSDVSAMDITAVVLESHTIFLPVVFNNYVSAPDLVVTDVVVSGDDVMVIITNEGNTSASDPFWVDMYINPTTPPTGINQTWETNGGEGLVWGIGNPSLAPSAAMTLTLSSSAYFADYSNFSGTITAGSMLYVQVDSAGSFGYGNVQELDESNNIYGPMITAVSSMPAGVVKTAVYPPALMVLRP